MNDHSGENRTLKTFIGRIPLPCCETEQYKLPVLAACHSSAPYLIPSMLGFLGPIDLSPFPVAWLVYNIAL
jgi:hypothetical protein